MAVRAVSVFFSESSSSAKFSLTSWKRKWSGGMTVQGQTAKGAVTLDDTGFTVAKAMEGFNANATLNYYYIVSSSAKFSLTSWKRKWSVDVQLWSW